MSLNLKGGALSYKSPNNQYTLAHVFSLAYPYGTPTVLSSYAFSSTDAGAPNGGYGTCTGTGPTNGWECQHTWTGIVGMIGFFNTVKGTALTNWVGGSPNQISFFRGRHALSRIERCWLMLFRFERVCCYQQRCFSLEFQASQHPPGSDVL